MDLIIEGQSLLHIKLHIPFCHEVQQANSTKYFGNVMGEGT